MAEVQRLPEADGDLADPRDPSAYRLDVLRARERHRHDRAASCQRQPGHARATAVQAAIAGARPLRVDTEGESVPQDLQGRVQPFLRSAKGSALNGNGAHGREEPPHPQAAYAVAGEVVGLGKEHDPAWSNQRDDEAVDEGEMIAGQQKGSGAGDILPAFDDRTIDQPGDRSQNGSGQQVEHGSSVVSGDGREATAGVPDFTGSNRASPWRPDPESDRTGQGGGFERARRVWHNDWRTRLSAAPLSASGVSFECHEPCPHADAVPTQPRPETGVTTNVAVKIRLKRIGKIHAPYYRVVIMNSRTKRDGRAIEEIGKYHPTEDPSIIEINSERVQYWLGVGAQPTEQVAALLKITGDWQKFKGLPGTEGTMRFAAPKADKRALYDAAANSAMAESKDGATTARRKKAEPKAETEKADAAKAEKAEPKADKADAPKAVKAGPKAETDKVDGPKAEKAESKAEKADPPKAEKADKPDKAEA